MPSRYRNVTGRGQSALGNGIDVSVNLRGQDEIARALDDLGLAVERRISRAALRAGVRVFESALRPRLKEIEVPRHGKYPDEHLWNSVIHKTILGAATFSIRVKYRGIPKAYGAKVEFGWANVPARPIWRGTFDDKQNEIYARIEESFSRGVQREWTKEFVNA